MHEIYWKQIKLIWDLKNSDYNSFRHCPICDKSHTRNILTIENFQFFCDDTVSKKFSLHEVQCENCGAIYLNPCFSDKGFEVLAGESGMSYGSSEIRPSERLSWIQKNHHLNDGEHVIDIGCGSGDFLKTLPNNIKKTGVDIDKPSIDKAQQKNQDISFICSPFEKFNINEKVDLITMFHVLEHLPNPLETLKRLHEIADENTALLIEVPIIENGATNDVCGFLSALHLTHFSRNSFQNILLLSGWEIIKLEEQKDYNGCRILAKKGIIQELSKLNPFEFSLPFQYLASWYSAVNELENKLREIPQNSKCVIWGGGMHLEFLYQMTSLFRGEHQFIIIDIDTLKQYKKWRGIDIYPPQILETIINDDSIVYIPSSYKGHDAIVRNLLAQGVKQTSIITLYDYIKIC